LSTNQYGAHLKKIKGRHGDKVMGRQITIDREIFKKWIGLQGEGVTG
jgi:hypothetical protein